MPKGAYERKEEHKKRMSETQKGNQNSFYGKHHTEEIKQRLSELAKGRKGYWTGKKLSEEHKRKLSEKAKTRVGVKNGFYGKHHTEETKKKLSELAKKRTISEEHKQKISDKLKSQELSEEHKQKISKARIGSSSWNKGKTMTEEHKRKISGENHYMWNPNREEVYAPYGENFYNDDLRNKKWKLQNGKDMLTGTKLKPNKKNDYHHIDYNKSNDEPENHCFISSSNHMRITNAQKDPIKSERYKKILQANTLALKNGQIPKNWSPLNKELFRQEKLKQLDLSSYII